MKKNTFIIVIALFLALNGFAQPHRIGSTNVYWELIVNGNDTTLKFTGEGALSIVYNGWYKYKNVKYIDIGEGITELPAFAFNDWFSLIKVNLPQSLKIIGANCFQNDTNLVSINLPQNLESVGLAAFFGIKGLPDTMRIPNVKNLDISCFARTNVKYIEIPLRMDTLQNGVFYSCVQLTTLTLPASLKHFIDGTFYNDSALSLVVNLNPEPQTFEVSKWGKNAFANVKRSQCRLIVPSSAVELYKTTPIWQDFLIEGGGLSVGVTVSPKEKGNVYGLEQRFYTKNEQVSLTAVPHSGCTFTGWKSNGVWISTDNHLSLTVTQDTLIEAVFEGELAVFKAIKTTDEVQIFPNPAHSQFTVESASPITQICIFELSGRKVLQVEGTNVVNVNGIAKGIYVIEIQTAERHFMKKFVKQ